MSVIRNRELRKRGFKTKAQRRLFRKYYYRENFSKPNLGYVLNNVSCNLGFMEDFWTFGKRIL